MRVAFLVPWGKKDGLSVYSNFLTGELQKKIEVGVFPLDNDFGKRLEPVGEINQFDVFHLQHELSQWGSFTNPFSSWYFDFLGKVKIPKVVTFHSVDLKGETWKKWGIWGRYRFLKMHSLPQKSIVHSQFLKDGLIAMGVPARQVELVPIGIPDLNLKFKAQSSKPEFKIQNFSPDFFTNKRIIAIFGFINPDKGYEIVLGALPKLPKDVVFVIAGGIQDETNRRYLENLQAMINNLAIDSRAVMTGFLEEDEMLNLMAAAAVVLFPRRHVNASLELSMAIGMRKPILASNLPAFKEINNRVPCLEIFDLNRPDDFYYRLKGILENGGLRTKLIEMTKLYAQQYSWARIAEKTIEIYQEVLR